MALLPNKHNISAASYEYSAEVIEFIINIFEEEPLLDKAEDVLSVMRKAVQIQRSRSLVEKSKASSSIN